MKKRGPSLHYITLLMVCQPLIWATPVIAEETSSPKLTAAQKSAIVDHCTSIKESLQNTQRSDARARVYLGRYYETILSDFITPLNLRLVENNISSPSLIDNQSSFATRRIAFTNDYISYQQGLEELVSLDCKAEPEKFYDQLVKVQAMRAQVKKDVSKLRGLLSDQISLVKNLQSSLKSEGTK